MIQTVAFYVLAIIAAVLVGWAFFSPYGFPIRPGRMVYLAGAALLLASLLLLPWITADPPDVRAENLAWLKAEPVPWWAVRAIMAIREGRLPDSSEAFDLKAYLCDTPERGRWYALLENHTRLSAWQLLLKAPTFSLPFTITLWGRLVLSIGALLAGIGLSLLGRETSASLRSPASRHTAFPRASTRISRKQNAAFARPVGVTRKVLGALAAFLLALALFQIPGADTRGLRQEFKLDYINLLAGVRIGGGMWWSLAGLTVIVVGLSLEEVDSF